jgi:dTDP-4-dehydrorhamnose 3,5-epimerase
MIFTETKLHGAYVVEIEKMEDERGFFARSWDKKEFEKVGLNSQLVQCSISLNLKKGTLRGMHFQDSPYEETKLVSCTRGRIFDVIVDLRENSPTRNKWFGVELTEFNHKMVYVPKGFAHGFQSQENDSVVFYQITQEYSPNHAIGIRWDDPNIGITWPLSSTIVSKKDQMWNYIQKSDLK